jgi:hypothetical protein
MSQPIVTVYLNQRMVFDILAMLQDGLSQVAKVTTTETDKDALTRGIDATFGVSNALASLLKIDLSARRSATREIAGETARSEERVHTPASLLFKLRDMLGERKELVISPDLGAITVRQMVEFTSTLRRNPVIQLMDTMLEVMQLAQGLEIEKEGTQRKGQGKHQSRQGATDGAKTFGQMKAFRDSLSAGSTVDIVSDRQTNGSAAVLTLELEFLSDPSMSNLVEGEFVVLGKVIRVVPEGESISLLRKTAMGALPDQMLTDAFAHFDLLSTVQGFVLPQAEWRVEGPAVHILPIAIYA